MQYIINMKYNAEATVEIEDPETFIAEIETAIKKDIFFKVRDTYGHDIIINPKMIICIISKNTEEPKLEYKHLRGLQHLVRTEE